MEPVVDLGSQPVGGRFPHAGDPPDELLPLRLGVCVSCGLAQLADRSPAQVDDQDARSPLTSTTMAAHARGFVDDLVERGLATPSARILSLASHGGHLVPFLRERGSSSTVFEGPGPRADRLAAEGQPVLIGHIDGSGPETEPGIGGFDLVIDSYLLAHLESPRAALARVSALLTPGGTLVLEFDDLLATVEGRQWDAIGHGHPVYLSLGWVKRELELLGTTIVEAIPQPVYGGALRVFAQVGGESRPSVDAQLASEASVGIGAPAGLAKLAGALDRARREVVPHLQAARAAGRRVVGYGAPDRAITFLNALETGPDLLPFVVDRAASKQGRTVPGVRVPIAAPEVLASDPPDEVLILTWNLVDEVRLALAPLTAVGTRLLVAVPSLADVTEEGGGARVLGD